MTLLLAPPQWDLTQDRVLVDGEMARVGPQLAIIVENSFITHPMRVRTSAEHRRRVDLATKIYFELRRDKRWTEQRSINHVRAALSASLDTTRFQPRDRTMFVRDTLLYPDAGPRTAIAL